jgi:cysteine dioxygenase
MKIVKIENFVEELCSIPSEDFGVENIFDFLAKTHIEIDSLNPYLYFSKKFYTRNLIFKNELFEVMALCWDEGQVSRIHNHSEQKCWMIVPVGTLQVKNFRSLECDESRNYCRIEEAENFDISQNLPAKVELDEPIHQVLNLSDKRAVSVHIYSKPFETCLSYCRETYQFNEVKLFYTSISGKLCDGISL